MSPSIRCVRRAAHRLARALVPPVGSATRAAALVGVLVVALATPTGAAAQDVRGWTTTTFRYVELRPLAREVVDPALLVEDDRGRLLLDGESVRCVPGGECVLYRPAGVEGAALGTQDLGLTAWGLGVRGLSFTTHLRGRARLGGDLAWPRSEDELDALLAYAQLDRGRWQVRLGRQQTLSGLGFTGYDGARVRVRPLSDLTLEAYGGRSLARGLAEPRNEALRGLEDFILDRSAYLVGGFVQASLERGTELGLRYQREIWSDRSGLISERASLDAGTDALRPYRLDGSLDYDVAFDRVGKAHLAVQRSFPSSGLLVALEGRRYVPYFELSTVWGFFSPVAYHEAVARVAWSGERTAVWARGGLRAYEDAEATVVFSPLEDDGWRAEAGASYGVAPGWTVRGRYEVEWGVGAFLSAGDASVGFRPSEDVELSAHATTFQRIEEFRLGDGRVFGGGLSAGLSLADGLRLDGGAAVYRHDDDGPVDGIWSQTRLWSALRLDFGEDPGRPRPRLRR